MSKKRKYHTKIQTCYNVATELDILLHVLRTPVMHRVDYVMETNEGLCVDIIECDRRFFFGGYIVALETPIQPTVGFNLNF